MKRNIKSLLISTICAGMILGNVTSVLAKGNGTDVDCGNSNIRSKSVQKPVGEPIYEEFLFFSRIATITVKVTSPCDDEFRSAHSDYAYQANRIVEKADDYLHSKFGIDFVSKGQPIWSSSSTDKAKLLDEAKKEHGLTYEKGSFWTPAKKADIMLAFSDVETNTFGRASVGKPYGIVFDNDYNQNAKSGQHEIGHMYGLNHHTGSDACVMKQGSNTGDVGVLCETHQKEWEKNKNDY